MSNRCNCSRIDITPRGNARINIGSGRVTSLDVGTGDIAGAINRHNLDESAHPYILNNYSSKQYTATKIQQHNTSYEAHPDLRKKANTFIYEQGVASSIWEIQHNMGKFPSVTVVDSADNEIVAEVHYIDNDNVVVTMNGASKGKAYLN